MLLSPKEHVFSNETRLHTATQIQSFPAFLLSPAKNLLTTHPLPKQSHSAYSRTSFPISGSSSLQCEQAYLARNYQDTFSHLHAIPHPKLGRQKGFSENFTMARISFCVQTTPVTVHILVTEWPHGQARSSIVKWLGVIGIGMFSKMLRRLAAYLRFDLPVICVVMAETWVFVNKVC